VQDRGQANLELPGVAIREAVMAAGHGRADYLLYVDRRAVGVIEAKPEGTTLSGVEWQSARYATGLPVHRCGGTCAAAEPPRGQGPARLRTSVPSGR
jgi:type I site-specific restriction endonuclease